MLIIDSLKAAVVFYSLFAGAFRSLWFGHLDIFTFISSQIAEMSGTHQ